MSDEGFSIEVPPATLEQFVELVAGRVLEELDGRDMGSAWPEWMTVDRAAAYLNVPAERLRKLIARRAIPYYQEAAGCRISFSRADLDAWMHGFQQPARRSSR